MRKVGVADRVSAYVPASLPQFSDLRLVSAVRCFPGGPDFQRFADVDDLLQRDKLVTNAFLNRRADRFGYRRADVIAAAGTAIQEATCLEPVECIAQGWSADMQPLSQFALGRQSLPGCKLTLVNQPHDLAERDVAAARHHCRSGAVNGFGFRGHGTGVLPR